MYKTILKRVIDIVIATVCLILTLPILLIVCLCLFWANGGKPFFVQQRPGKNAKPFNIIKFKTMNDRRNSQGELLPDDQRLTKVGAIIRKTSIDELPQLLNVLNGDMSLIGPRPLLMEYVPLYSKEQMKRHDIRPGITGWAQVNGRNAISWTDKFNFDIWYVENMSIWLDMKILFLTLKKVFVKEGISSSTSVTMEKFTGEK